MQILTSPHDMMLWRKNQLGTIGFVPTMGALHNGHVELIRQSTAQNSATVLSVFVNATQFNELADFDAYPRTFEADKEIAITNGVDAIYAPSHEAMYPDNFHVFIEPGTAAAPMEGASRPGHFRGVSTIVVKLLNAVQPTNAYFGEKDYQQLAVIREVTNALNMSTEIVGVPTVRDKDGLALSSRNTLLNPQHRQKAVVIWKSGERNTKEIIQAVENSLRSEAECVIDYVTACDAQTLETHDVLMSHSVICIAVRFGEVRLIDNIQLHP
jgi:pantoate--beta-alanine ligase